MMNSRVFLIYGVLMLAWMVYLGSTPLIPWSELDGEGGSGGYYRGGGSYHK